MSTPPTHPSCERGNGTECEPCNELTKIEFQIVQLEELYELHRQARVKRNYIHSPLIHQFPLEVVTSIFILAFPPLDACRWCSTHREQASPFILTKVCHTWRALALSTPRLWSCITVDVEKPNVPLLNHQIAYSGLVPLSVNIFVPNSGPMPQLKLSSAKQVISRVMKQLHIIASLSFWFTEGSAIAWGSILNSDYPKTAPLLEELHFHCLDDGPSSSFQLKLAIEPPRPRRVHFETISFDQICIDWTSVSMLDLGPSHIRTLPLGLKNLEYLSLNYTNWNIPTEQTPIIHQSIQHVTADEDSDIVEFMLTMTLPSLRTLDIALTEMPWQPLSPIICDFLHRSLCPLQVLRVDIAYEDDGERMIQALLDVLQIVTGLQQLIFVLRSSNEIPSSILEPLIRQFSSRDRGFLPCLQILSLELPFIPPIDLLLDAMAPNAPPSEIPNGSNKERPLHILHLELPNPLNEVGPIQKDVLVRILQMRADGKNISIVIPRRKEGERDLVEHWKSFYGFEEA